MTDRIELLESVMDCLLDGVAVFSNDGEVVYWNQPAQAIMGYSSAELVGRPTPEPLRCLHRSGSVHIVPETEHTSKAHPFHKLGHEVQVINRAAVLCNKLGDPIGEASFFHPAESVDALPHGSAFGSKDIHEEAAEIEERLRIALDEFKRGGLPFGVVRISIDQAAEMHRTHGLAACHEMFEKVHHVLSRGLRPGEAMGRWGEDEFLIVAHERTLEMLAAHARNLAGLARTADFRWWGDRVSLTVSIGVAQVRLGVHETLDQLLERACAAMETSIGAGGNSVTAAPVRVPADFAAETLFISSSNERQSDSLNAAEGESCSPSSALL